jgi:hypothetical protein
MMGLIVQATNDKIEEDFLIKDYSEDTLAKSPHITQTDEVSVVISQCLGTHHLYLYEKRFGFRIQTAGSSYYPVERYLKNPFKKFQ